MNLEFNAMAFMKALCLSAIAVFAPIQPLILTTVALIFSDLILGIWAALKDREKITSAVLRRTVTKLFVYEISLLAGFLGEKYLLGGAYPVVKLIGGAIATVELTSILENAGSITGLSFGKIIKILGSKNDVGK